jgi:hypothetical protein
MLHYKSLTRRIGQRWEPTRAPCQGSKRNEGGPKRFTLVLCALPPFLFELHAINPVGPGGRPPENNCLQSSASCLRLAFKLHEFLVFLDR